MPVVLRDSARAMLEIGGAAAEQALLDLALGNGSSETRTYAALVLIASRGRDSEAVRRLTVANDPEIRHLLEHGLELHESHGAE